jgi:hypothetical protein
VRNEEVLHRVREQRNILKSTKRKKANWISHTLPRNCLFKHVIEGKIDRRIDMAGRRRRIRRQLLDNLQEIESGSARSQYVVK